MEDLRVVKTKKAIESAFLQLRESKSLEEVKVSELCRIALINKTTFYHYYNDIYHLSDCLEQVYLKECFLHVEGYDSLITNTEKFIKSILHEFSSNDKLQIIFKGRTTQLVAKAQDYILEQYQYRIKTEKEKMSILFLIQGAFFILFHYRNKNEKLKLSFVIDAANTIIQTYFSR